ncbi:histone deacetylase Hos1p [[Candida] railenensis]|uniref:Histone deacetylase Hos1p n=1 Tax=[Candida] railenensis TaxID=45579 RepID=A0A9P0QTF7_9ASCO|nr:histone deacetylase Hos1p [[Candida] railenensis]
MNQRKTRRQVGITSSEYVSKICDLLPSNEGRQSMIYWLIRAYGIDSACEYVIPIERSTPADLKKFHDAKFVDVLLERRPNVDSDAINADELLLGRNLRSFKDSSKTRKSVGSMAIQNIRDAIAQKVFNSDTDDSDPDSDSDSDNDEVGISEDEKRQQRYSSHTLVSALDKYLDTFGLKYDCVVFPFLSDYVQLVAGSTISTANYLIKNSKLKDVETQSVGINWYGGRHHCHKSKAAGFCYVNDIVLGINTLRTFYPRVFYLDLDLHHGDGVETAFKFSSKVVTCSVHRFDVGFYPGSGSKTEKGKYLNIPTKKGLSDKGLENIIKSIIAPILKDFSPSVVVLQLGSDGLALDEHKMWNFTIRGFARNVMTIVDSLTCPIMILGGGGYNNSETAKFCTYMTNSLLNTPVAGFDVDEVENDSIPEHPSLDDYEKDGYKFWTNENTLATKMADENDEEYLKEIENRVIAEWFD